MDRAAKKELVTTLNGVFKDTNVVVVAHYSGLNVGQMQTLLARAENAQSDGAIVRVVFNNESVDMQDAYAKAHPMEVEGLKTGHEKGRYLTPKEHGKPESAGVAAAIAPGTGS